jgi:hypothetical protein
MDMFHIFLPSNAPVDGNLTGNYTVRFPNVIDLTDGEWSVALSSIIYPVSYASGEKEEMYIQYNYYDKNIVPKKFYLSSDVIFTSVNHLQNIVNDSIIEKTRVKRQKQQTTTEKLQESLKVSSEVEKKLSSAKSEVKERSYKKVFDLGIEIDEKIFDIEALAAHIEHVSELILLKAKPQDDFTNQEASDFKTYALQKNNEASKIRGESQEQRSWINEHQNSYKPLISEIDNAIQTSNVLAARKVADKAKKLAGNIKEIEKIIINKNTIIKKVWEEIVDKDKELEEVLKPIDTALKNNIQRIKKIILNSITTDQQNKLDIYFYYDANIGKFFLYNHKPTIIKTVYINPRLAYILGFDVDKGSNEVKRIRMRHGGGFAKYTPDISSGIHQLYVYSPGLVDTSYVGNIQAPLLRIINVDKSPNTVAESIYTNMYFMRVIEKRISEIKIIIKDSFNDILRFNWGNVIVTLSFKKNLF